MIVSNVNYQPNYSPLSGSDPRTTNDANRATSVSAPSTAPSKTQQAFDPIHHENTSPVIDMLFKHVAATQPGEIVEVGNTLWDSNPR
ncbi:hypothetical protein [Algicola sagamiensis]|uniref:hypothetical protein n=1 Tax=Algicola sagamiensis TaxID=163869 RepID=UPI00036B410D|nr:hypothetical protein [Algicola sagamiensis]